MRPSLSTTGGDNGFTGLFGGERVFKTSHRLHAYARSTNSMQSSTLRIVRIAQTDVERIEEDEWLPE